jgi:PilZ domain
VRREPAPAAVEEAPRVNGRVQVAYPLPDDEPGRLTTRLEDVRGARRGVQYLVAAPASSTEARQPERGIDCTLEWTSTRGLWSLAVRFTGLERGEHETRYWVLDQVGGAVRLQRRRFVRVEWAVPLAVVRLPADGRPVAADVPPERPLLGRTRDVGEGGVACVLDGDRLPDGTAVRVVLGVADTPVETTGRVLSSEPGDEEGTVTAVIAFDDPGTVGDRLRPLLFEEQRRQRRLTAV